MYGSVYVNLYNIDIAIMHSEERIYNIEENVVENASKIFGLLTKFKLVHPDYFMFMDKVGSNLYCNIDKNASSKKYI